MREFLSVQSHKEDELDVTQSTAQITIFNFKHGLSGVCTEQPKHNRINFNDQWIPKFTFFISLLALLPSYNAKRTEQKKNFKSTRIYFAYKKPISFERENVVVAAFLCCVCSWVWGKWMWIWAAWLSSSEYEPLKSLFFFWCKVSKPKGFLGTIFAYF